MTNLKKEAMARQGFDARHDYCPDSVRRDAAGWVLGALDAAETQRFAGHLLTCRACRMTVAELQPAAEALLALSTLQPPEHLAAATLAKVRQTARDTAIRQIATAMAILQAEGSHSPAGLGTGLRMAAATGRGASGLTPLTAAARLAQPGAAVPCGELGSGATAVRDKRS